MGEACFYHPDRQCLVSRVCVCDWCSVLCCMSRWMIGLLIFPLAEHKSLFYPPSLNLSRVKCLCSQLLTVLCVCLSPFMHFVCVLSRITLRAPGVKQNGKKKKRQLKNTVLSFLSPGLEFVWVHVSLSHTHTNTERFTSGNKQRQSQRTQRKSWLVT